MPIPHTQPLWAGSALIGIVNVAQADYYRAMIRQGPDIGAIVRELRRSRGVTQSQLASLLSVDRSALSRIENGVRELTALELLKIASAFGEDVCTVAGGVHSGSRETDHPWDGTCDTMMAVPTPSSLPAVRIKVGWTVTVGFEEPGLWVPNKSS